MSTPPSEIVKILDQDGMLVIPDVFSGAFMNKVVEDIDLASKYCLNIQMQQKVGSENGLPEKSEGGDGALGGAAHHVICFERSFFDILLQEPLFDSVEEYLGEGAFILNSFGAVTNTNQNNMYEHGKTIHRDSRSFHPSFRQQCWLMVMVDDFTAENGATWMWKGSHRNEYPPKEEVFYQNAEQVLGKKGSVAIFDGRIWHAAGKNHTPNPRRCLTISFTKPYLKPQFDYVRYFGEERVKNMPPILTQLFGYNARIPSNYSEWYQPAETRFYKSNQG